MPLSPYLLNICSSLRNSTAYPDASPAAPPIKQQLDDFHFNSHAHEGRDVKLLGQIFTINNFNSHAHEGRDASHEQADINLLISTHTPTRGVTSCLVLSGDYTDISTHTPTRGVTPLAPGERMCYYISTHTPTRGVTENIKDVPYLVHDFNSHAHEGRD